MEDHIVEKIIDEVVYRLGQEFDNCFKKFWTKVEKKIESLEDNLKTVSQNCDVLKSKIDSLTNEKPDNKNPPCNIPSIKPQDERKSSPVNICLSSANELPLEISFCSNNESTPEVTLNFTNGSKGHKDKSESNKNCVKILKPCLEDKYLPNHKDTVDCRRDMIDCKGNEVEKSKFEGEQLKCSPGRPFTIQKCDSSTHNKHNQPEPSSEMNSICRNVVLSAKGKVLDKVEKFNEVTKLILNKTVKVLGYKTFVETDEYCLYSVTCKCIQDKNELLQKKHLLKGTGYFLREEFTYAEATKRIKIRKTVQSIYGDSEKIQFVDNKIILGNKKFLWDDSTENIFEENELRNKV